MMLLGLSINIAAQLPSECDGVLPQNPTQAENMLCGTTSWQIGVQGATNRQIEGYASATSVNKGETITFYVNQTYGTTFKFDIFRMGWYQGNGGRLVASRINIPGKHQPLPQVQYPTGLIECDWTLGPGADSLYKWTVPTSAVSGVYIVKLTTEQPLQYSSYIIFVVRDDARQSDIVYQTSDTTWQAYNLYPGNRDPQPPSFAPNDGDPIGVNYSGKNLYQQNFGLILPPGQLNNPVTQARKVSYNRPYGQDNNRIDLTAGQFFSWEYNMVRWIERNGYDVSYISNLDTHTANTVNGRFAPGRHKTFLSVGHDEYWSREMRLNIENARNAANSPMNLAFFSANTMFWQIRLDSSSPAGTQPAGAPNRTIIAYKDYARNAVQNAADPKYNNNYGQTEAPITSDDYLITNRWRDNISINQTLGGTCPPFEPTCYRPPEDEVMGVQYSYPFNQPGTDSGDNAPSVCNSPSGFCPAFGDLIIPAAACPTWICGGMKTVNGNYNLGFLIGYEADRIFPNHTYTNRSSFLTIGNSPVYNDDATMTGIQFVPTPYNSHLVYFTLPNGAKVFSTGTIQYPWGLDDYSPLAIYNDVNGIPVQERVHPALTTINAQAFAGNIFGCLVGGVCQ